MADLNFRTLEGISRGDIINMIYDGGKSETAVSEAVTNAIVHGYPRGADGEIRLAVKLLPDDCAAEILVSDDGVGIENVEQAMQPFYTTQPEMERSGMGFSVMQSFMDELRVESAPGEGTRVFMKKQFEG